MEAVCFETGPELGTRTDNYSGTSKIEERISIADMRDIKADIIDDV